MKIFIDLLDDEFREIFPAALFEFKRKCEDYLIPKNIDRQHLAGLISAAYVNIAVNEVHQLAQRIACFEYNDEDIEDGFLQSKMGRFSLELKTDEVIDKVGKAFDEMKDIEMMIKMSGPEAGPLKEAWEHLNRDEFKEMYMGEFTTMLRHLEAQVWEHIVSRLKEILIVVEPMQPLTISKF
ncbi:hypothetical protein ABN904_000742 [Salmonella enterica subsp. enterica serovar Bredeney]|nr:hypothetical protein [Salmonella enterica subsp. enterica serovar Virchow]ECV7366415.1 hypothetical protein [Salmonella enterica subsp. enterica serovar Enteritidis]